MKQPINLLLYTASVGMLGLSGYEFYRAVPDLGGAPSLTSMHEKGRIYADEAIKKARAAGAQTPAWDYTRPAWETFASANFTGKLPPKPEVAKAPEPGPTTVKPAARPLHEVLSVLSVMADMRNNSDAESKSFVSVRYKEGSGVKIPDGVLAARSDVASSPGGTGIAQRVSPLGGPRGRPAPADRGATQPVAAPSAMPTLGATNKIVQTLRLGEALWEPFDNVVLKRMADDGLSAFFVRKTDEGESEEELFCSESNISNDALAAMVKMLRENENRRAGASPGGASVELVGQGDSIWFATDETAIIPGRPNERAIGRNDSRMFRESPDEIFEQVNLQPYTMRDGRTGLNVANVNPQLAQRFGVNQGDVILEVNSQPVTSKAAAIRHGRQEYDRGVRVFRVKVLSFGQEVTRVYHAENGNGS